MRASKYLDAAARTTDYGLLFDIWTWAQECNNALASSFDSLLESSMMMMRPPECLDTMVGTMTYGLCGDS